MKTNIMCLYRYVWRQPNSEMNIKKLRPTIRHGNGSVMLRGNGRRCMTTSGTGNLVFVDGILDKYKYLGILKKSLKDRITKLGLLNNFYFKHHNDSKHTTRIVKK